jgi:hypothetical protein
MSEANCEEYTSDGIPRKGSLVRSDDRRVAQFVAMDPLQGDQHHERSFPAFGRRKYAPSRRTTISMRLAEKFGLTLGKVLWTAGLALALALPAGSREHTESMVRDQTQADMSDIVSKPVSTLVAPESPPLDNRREVTSYVMDSEGDHSLDGATVVEQVFSGYTSYTVQLHLASGAEQSIAVTAPPGGLQIEMHDMTGDKVPNDLVLTPTLLSWPPTVLLNDGHDHFTVAISVDFPGFSREDRASSPHDVHSTVALMSCGFKAGRHPNGGGLFLPQLQADLLSLTNHRVTRSLGYSTSSGRSPPTLATKI